MDVTKYLLSYSTPINDLGEGWKEFQFQTEGRIVRIEARQDEWLDWEVRRMSRSHSEIR